MNGTIGYLPASPQAAVRAARWAASGMSASLVGLGLLGEAIHSRTQSSFMVVPAGLVGLVSIAMGYRSYELIRSRLNSRMSDAARSRTFFLATVTALAVSETAGLFGVVVYILSGRVVALIGVLTHVILAGVIWPSHARYEAFEDS